LRLRPRTLQWRLAASAAVLIAISFAITFVAVYRGTGSSLMRQINREIAGDAGTFSRTLENTRGHSPGRLLSTAQRYMRDQPYTGSSTLLFALTPGMAPVSNQPELFAARARPDPGETVAVQARENQGVAKLLHAPRGYSTLALPDVGQLRLLRQNLRIHGTAPVVVGVGEPLATVKTAQAGVARAFILAGILVLACALLAAYLLGARFSAPLRRMAGVAARVDAGDLQPRIHEGGDRPEEVRVLADAFNHMLDRLTEAFASQRAFIADASHELRTPLTVLRGQLELLAADPNPTTGEVRRVSAVVEAEIARITRLVDDLLVLAKAERSELLRPESIELQSYVRELWEATRLIASRRFELGQIPAGSVRADPHQLAQALRNLVANAIEHTSQPDGLVRLSARAVYERQPAVPEGGERQPGLRIRFVVDDDGPGIPADQREQIFGRFYRTDSARDRRSGGAGLGLAIARAIARVHGGSVAASSSPYGGARVELELPGFRAAHAGDPAPRRSMEVEGPSDPAGRSTPAGRRVRADTAPGTSRRSSPAGVRSASR
jgi:signal transduction histidine kinase